MLELDAGEYEVDFIVHLTGNLRKGKDYEQSVQQSIGWQAVALLALDKLAGHVSKSIVKKVLKESMRVDSKALEDLKARTEAAWGKIAEKAKQKVSGKLTGSVSAEIVELEQSYG